jgi:hypothetical protein
MSRIGRSTNERRKGKISRRELPLYVRITSRTLLQQTTAIAVCDDIDPSSCREFNAAALARYDYTLTLTLGLQSPPPSWLLSSGDPITTCQDDD